MFIGYFFRGFCWDKVAASNAKFNFLVGVQLENGYRTKNSAFWTPYYLEKLKKGKIVNKQLLEVNFLLIEKMWINF